MKVLTPDQLDERTDSGKSLAAWLGRRVRLHFGPTGPLVRHKTRKFGVRFFFKCPRCGRKEGPIFAVSGLHAGAWCYIYNRDGKYLANMRDDNWNCLCVTAPKVPTKIRAVRQGGHAMSDRWRSDKEYGIFLLWVQKERPNNLAPNVDLRAVDTVRTKVETHAMMVQRDEPDAEAIWIEERVTNHLYGQRDVAKAFKFRDIPGLWKRDS